MTSFDADQSDLAKLVRSNYVAFAHNILKDITGGGKKFQLASMQLAWIAHVNYCWERGLGALINAPLGHGKTAVLIIGFALYLLQSNTNNRVKIISAIDGLAKDRVGGIRQYIDDDQDFKRFCPHVRCSRVDRALATSRRRKWAGNKLLLERTGYSPDASLEAYGMISSGVGGRCEYELYDDPVDAANSNSELNRKKVSDRFFKVWLPRLEPWGRWLMVSTPYHHEDLNAELHKNPTVCSLIQAVSADYKDIDFRVLNAADRDHPLMPMRIGA